MRNLLVALFLSGSVFAQEITPQQVIQNYINAIGGEENIDNIKDIYMVAEIDAMGQDMEMITMKKAPNKFLMIQSMSGMELSKVTFDGENVKVIAQGNEIPVDEAQLQAYKDQSAMIGELSYLEGKVNLELLPNEEVDGEDCYVLEISTDEGSSKEYYSVTSGLKVRQDIEAQGMLIISYIKDYKEFSGVKFPTAMRQEVMGQAIETVFSTIKVNEGIDDSEFN